MNSKKMAIRVLTMVIIFGVSLNSAFSADIANAKDHPLISRYEGSEIFDYKSAAFDEYPLFINEISNNNGIEGQPESVLWLEGRVSKYIYVNPPERTTLEIFRNYETALKDAGFEIIFSCKNKSCGGYQFKRAMDGYIWLTSDDQRYLAAKLARDEGDVYMSLYTTPSGAGGGPTQRRVLTQLHVIEVEAMQENMVTVDADAMAKGIGEEGRIALYGILFDVDAATIKTESKPTLEQITTLLNSQADLELVIVGHTDNQGELQYNMDLSKRRAEAIKAALVGDHGIDSNRLSAWGVGYLSPVASNRDETGRAKNRRVELVEK